MADNLFSMQSHDGAEATLQHLNDVDNETLVRLSELSIPEIERLKREIANIFPAGTLPSMILSGLITLNGRRISRKRVDDDIQTLFQGAKLLPRGLYSVLFAGPAVVLAAYQKILTLSGKTAEEAFPEGLWQFYLQFALREDTGRHTNETIAYHRDRPRRATLVDDIAAWVMTAVHALFDTDGLTGALWTESTTLRLICDAMLEANLVDESPYASILRSWQLTRPYRTPAGDSYAERRRTAFDRFAQKYYEQLPTRLLQEVGEKLHHLAEAEREAYQNQMSLLAYLNPTRYRDERVSIPLWQAKVGLIWRGHITLFDACARDDQGLPLAFSDADGEHWPLQFDAQGIPLDREGNRLVIQGGWLYRFDARGGAEPVAYLSPPDEGVIKGLVAGAVGAVRMPASSTVDLQLVEAPRAEQEKLRGVLPEETRHAIKALEQAPILINWDEQDRSLPLGVLRRKAQRGVGDHPLTIMRTADSMIFDQSHIFFDGTWGMAMSEVLTNQAVSWCHHMVNIAPRVVAVPPPLEFPSSPQFEARLTSIMKQVQPIIAEADAEAEAGDLSIIATTRMWLQQRGVKLTINDLLLIARVLHGAAYTPSREAAQATALLPDDLRAQVVESLEGSRAINPALLIPMDASLVSPRERIFPVTFRNPLATLLKTYASTISILKQFRVSPHDEDVFRHFEAQRAELLAHLRAFGQTLEAIKGIAMQGQSINVATLKLLGHLSPSMQHVLNQIPERVGILNEIVKGEEVFSNVGRVVADASLVRFLSAKDDGRAKRLVWGILTDDQGKMRITMRDFRPHVVPLHRAGREDLAQHLAQEYVETYADTLLTLAAQLSEIALVEDMMRWE